MKLVTIIGARPQFIKAAAVSRAIHQRNGFDEVIVHTGQHYDDNMSQVFFDELDIPKPTYNLKVGSGLHGTQTGLMLTRIEQVLLSEKPDLVLIYGDTNSTLSGALASSKLNIPVAHVEAGLRSFNRKMPEETNRIVSDHVSDILFAPTRVAMKNLTIEGLKKKAHYVGDVMCDAAVYYLNKIDHGHITPLVDFTNNDNYVLCTIHRAENTDNLSRLRNIIIALNEINRSIEVIVPLHPRTRKKIEEHGLKLEMTVVEPTSYLEMLFLIKNSCIVITDSGGVQKEAYFCKKYCITLRNETEWQELVDAKVNVLVGTKKEKILEAVFDLYNKAFLTYDPFYGFGNAAEKILGLLEREFANAEE